jgi:hypothetical protein
MRIIIGSHSNKANKKTNMNLLMQKISGSALYRGVVEKSPLNFQYLYSSRVEENKLIFNCTEKYFSNSQSQQHYDVMSINIDTSEVDLKSEVEVGILNSFVRINFNIINICENRECSGHTYISTGVIAGGKSKKIMPFFLREEFLVAPGSDASVIYTLRSDYYSQTSMLEKTNEHSDYTNTFNGLLTTEAPTILPLIDMSIITTRNIFENKVENYVTFS